MISFGSGLAIAVINSLFARYKGRTWWHWFLFSLFSFAFVWGLAIFTLYIANVSIFRFKVDAVLAGFSGALTWGVTFAILVFVPVRPRPRIAALGPGAQRSK